MPLDEVIADLEGRIAALEADGSSGFAPDRPGSGG
jgi:hypothetical protein